MKSTECCRCLNTFTNEDKQIHATHINGLPGEGLSFQNFPKKGVSSEFSHKKVGAGKIGGFSKKGGFPYFHTNSL